MTSPLPRLLDYPLANDRYDEVWTGTAARSHWQTFFDHLSEVSGDTLAEREQFLKQSVLADGVTYNLHADAHVANRPWDLDVLPMIIPASEWLEIEQAVCQRAELLNMVIGDLLGPQTLLKDALIPPAVVFGQLGFPWPLVGVEPAFGTHLHLYAADIARGPDGRFWILSDRTQAPAGAAYALQNRMTLARAFPDVFRAMGVVPIGGFFGAIQDALTRFSRVGDDTPLTVLLTPGPYNETYFEHVFLSRHLGFPLVEGQDLIVRGDVLFLKTLRGLRRVHAVLRRLDDDYCDPVELRSDSALGVPGLLAAVRAGNVLLANGIGSGIAETASIQAFLPAICEKRFGRSLLLPGVPSYWCGEPDSLAYTCDNLNQLVVKPTYPSMGMEPVFGHTLGDDDRRQMLDRLRAQPHAYVAQQWVHLSRAPARSSGIGSPFAGRSVSIRVFAVATPDGYKVLPGGLTRAAPKDGDVVSMKWGGSAKDTWILGDSAVRAFPPFRRKLAAADVVQSSVQIPSRVGENLFWVGRYSERCEAIARLLRAALVRTADVSASTRPALSTLGAACDALGILDVPPISDRSITNTPLPDFLGAVVNQELSGGLAANVSRLCFSASHVRERMSTDNWHVLHSLQAKIPTGLPTSGAALQALDDVMLGCVSLAGFAMDDMTRDESWRFLLLGRRLERLVHLTSLLHAILLFPSEARDASLEWLLEAANSIVTYRARYRALPELLPVIHLVALDPSNPHAVLFQLNELLHNLEISGRELDSPMPEAELRGAIEKLASSDLRAFEAVEPEKVDQACATLAAGLAHARGVAFDLSDVLHRRFFSHAATPAPVGV
ncbi:MAG: circularly permuted type 2 ATP-grasp protein [Polyangiaceae bacterium]|nr:circularly permuted type 2 ATP-grasp protein [Polyangiaceae bacterium]